MFSHAGVITESEKFTVLFLHRSVSVFMRAALNSIMFWNIEFREPQPCCWGIFSSSDRLSLIVIWKGSHVYIASCDKEVQRHSELSASLLSNRRCFLSKCICACVVSQRVRKSK